MNNRNSKQNYHTVGTHDRRVIYCYLLIKTETPVETLPDIITGAIHNSVWYGEEYRRFDSVATRQSFIDSFDLVTYKPKQLSKRNMNDISKITGDTLATGFSIVKTKQVDMKKVVKGRI